MIAHGCPSSECAIVNPLLCARMGQAGKRSTGNGRLASNVRPSVHLLLPSAPPAFRSRSLSPTSVFVRCMKPFTLFFSPCQSVRSASDRASLSADDEMASKKRKGERARLRVSLSHTHTVRSLPALSSRTIAANPNVLRHLDHFKARQSLL